MCFSSTVYLILATKGLNLIFNILPFMLLSFEKGNAESCFSLNNKWVCTQLLLPACTWANIYIVLPLRWVYEFYFFIYTEGLGGGTELNSNKPASAPQFGAYELSNFRSVT